MRSTRSSWVPWLEELLIVNIGRSVLDPLDKLSSRALTVLRAGLTSSRLISASSVAYTSSGTSPVSLSLLPPNTSLTLFIATKARVCRWVR